MKKDFTVLIVGRENVGKSSVFNRLIGNNKAIVDDFPGVTRDKLYGEAEWMGKTFKLIDTGGLLFDEQDLIKNIVIKQVEQIIKEVDLVLFMVDAKTGLVHDDEKIFSFIRKNTKKFVVVVNKVDNNDKLQDMYDFYNMGVETLFPVSAAHSYGLDDLLDYITSLVPEKEKEEEDKKWLTKIAIIGKENVGKSSLFNALIKEERSIVTEIPGTTRNYVDTIVELGGRKFIMIDTAGVKKRKRIRKKAEEFSIGRAFANTKRSDIVLHVIDAIEGIQEMDKRVIGYAYEHYKGIVIAVNKWDLVKKTQREQIKKDYFDYIRKSFKFLSFAPIAFISAKEKSGLKKIIDIVFYVENQYNFRVKTSVLNRVFQEAIYKKPPAGKKGPLRVYYISQVATKPPTFALFVNKKERVHFNYTRYLENELRKNFGFEGVPLKINIKEKKRD